MQFLADQCSYRRMVALILSEKSVPWSTKSSSSSKNNNNNKKIRKFAVTKDFVEIVNNISQILNKQKYHTANASLGGNGHNTIQTSMIHSPQDKTTHDSILIEIAITRIIQVDTHTSIYI